ncbi:MAG: cell wall hydrolase [Lachnospiraceae bacterium]|nr:cell wall hydrolase [Lachnospiraceae bacterium]
MFKRKHALLCLAGITIATCMTAGLSVNAHAAATKSSLVGLNAGVGAILEHGSTNGDDVIAAATKAVDSVGAVTEGDEEEILNKSTLVMANVKQELNVRSTPDNDGEKVGKIYKDCGGTILLREDGWTKIQSGNVIGWANDKYLLFDEDAKELAKDVGNTIATVATDTLRVRTTPDANGDTMVLLPKGDVVDVVEAGEDGWVTIDYEGVDGYVCSEFVDISFRIDNGETIDEIKAREAAEAAAKAKAAAEAQKKSNNVSYSSYNTDVDTTRLLAALIQCEAGGESYEGQVAVGAVVMNRVRSSAYPNSVSGVIYASGQFTPAMNGKVGRLCESGKISDSCMRAAQDALNGTSNVGSCTHFKRNNGREGTVIGNHVFY